MRFCEICENLLKLKTIDYKLYYVCNICEKQYDLNAEDTKIKSYHVNIVDDVYKKNKNLIELFKYDNMLQLIERECINCKHNIMKQCILGKNMDFIYICDKCKNIEV
jgi:DNA-directed RNA polymerase subunit M/transcription elongation factor TFIIS